MLGFSKNIRLSKNKSFEIQVDLFNKNISSDFFSIDLKWTTKQDHAGPSFTFSIFKTIYFAVQIYDSRHWDHDNDCWVKYD